MQRDKWQGCSNPSTHTLQKCCCRRKEISSGSLKASYFYSLLHLWLPTLLPGEAAHNKKPKTPKNTKQIKPKQSLSQQLDSLVSPFCWGGDQFIEAQTHRDSSFSPMGDRAAGEWKMQWQGQKEGLSGEKKRKKGWVKYGNQKKKSQQGEKKWERRRKNRRKENEHKTMK